jgi:hypothetical protein
VGRVDVERLEETYYPQFDEQWMPCEYILSYQELSDLRIENYIQKQTITAYKDFKSKSINGSKIIK